MLWCQTGIKFFLTHLRVLLFPPRHSLGQTRMGYTCGFRSTSKRSFPISHWHYHLYVNVLVQERCNSSALAMELCLSCTKPSMCCWCWKIMYGISLQKLAKIYNTSIELSHFMSQWCICSIIESETTENGNNRNCQWRWQQIYNTSIQLWLLYYGEYLCFHDHLKQKMCEEFII